MVKNLALLFALLAILVGPIFLRPVQPSSPQGSGFGERTVAIVTPHNEAIRYEFGRAFEQSYLAQTGQRVGVDWRSPGGTSEISRYIDSEFLAAFQDHWVHQLGRRWSGAAAASFANPKVTPGSGTIEQEARRAFLESSVSCKLDLFFGGGAFDFEKQAKAGGLVDCGFVREHPELFNDRVVPGTVGGEPYWDPQGRWIGTVVSSYGIVYNVDSMRRLGIVQAPAQWVDLAQPRLFHQVAIANPTQSGSVNKSFEMLIQQQISEAIAAAEGVDQTTAPAEREKRGVRQGWAAAMRLLMKIAGNARYFTDSSTKISLDVEAGEAAAGMTIDFYGRFQSEAVRKPEGSSRLQYSTVVGGSSFGVDPIGLFRGAPNADVAKAFIAFVMSPAGQKLWNWKIGTPGGPRRYALRRLPVLPQLYAPEFKPLRSDPEINPYELARTFTYHEAWTGRLFRPIAFIVRVMCIDPHDELTEAWQALIAANFSPEARAAFEEVSTVDYEAASGGIREALGGDKIKEVQLARDLADRFREQYRRAAELARAGK